MTPRGGWMVSRGVKRLVEIDPANELGVIIAGTVWYGRLCYVIPPPPHLTQMFGHHHHHHHPASTIVLSSILLTSIHLSLSRLGPPTLCKLLCEYCS